MERRERRERNVNWLERDGYLYLLFVAHFRFVSLLSVLSFFYFFVFCDVVEGGGNGFWEWRCFIFSFTEFLIVFSLVEFFVFFIFPPGWDRGVFSGYGFGWPVSFSVSFSPFFPAWCL
jgi:hypothetical protein